MYGESLKHQIPSLEDPDKLDETKEIRSGGANEGIVSRHGGLEGSRDLCV